VANRPLWRKGFDLVEGAAGRRLEDLVRTGGFAQALGLAARARADVAAAVERRTRGALHLFNLPAASDVTRLRRQVAALDHEVRRLTATLERSERAQRRQEEAGDAGGQPGRPGRARPSGRAAQRPPRT
jgi:hypothetical protein